MGSFAEAGAAPPFVAEPLVDVPFFFFFFYDNGMKMGRNILQNTQKYYY